MTQMEKDIHEIAKAITKIANKDNIKEKTKADFLALYADESSSENSNKWIPCSERLPEEMGTYMTTIDYGEHGLVTGQRYYYGRGLWGERGLVTGQRYYYGRGLWNDGRIITWMPLKPEPYKAESEDKE